MTYEGACHCGSVVVWFETKQAPEALQVRADGCGFCRRHGAKSVTDPEGWLEFRAAPGSLRRYQFGHRTADFLICAECGVYIGAVTTAEFGAGSAAVCCWLMASLIRNGVIDGGSDGGVVVRGGRDGSGVGWPQRPPRVIGGE